MKGVLHFFAVCMTFATLALPYGMLARSWFVRWGDYFLALLTSATVTGLLYCFAQRKEDGEARAPLYVGIAFCAACVIWFLTFVCAVANIHI